MSIVVAGLLFGAVDQTHCQVRLVGPPAAASPIPVESPRNNPFRKTAQAQQAQFQIAPQIPPATEELAMPGSHGNGPMMSTDMGGLEPLPAGAESYAPMEINGPAGEPIYYDESTGGPLEEMVVDGPPAVMYSTNDWFRRGIWYSQQDIVVLLRTDVKDVRIAADQTETQIIDRPMLTSKSVTPTYVPGTRLTLGRFLGQDVANRDYALEIAFFGLFDYTEQATLVSTVPGQIDTALGQNNEFFYGFGVAGPPVPGFSGASSQSVLYSSDLNSLEANLRILGRPLRDSLTLQPNGSWVRYGTSSHLLAFLLGLRGVSLNELFLYQSNYISSDLNRGTYQVQTRNDMFGPQVGLDGIENYTNWSWGGRFKAGMLYNFADRRSHLDTLADGDAFSNSQEIDKENLCLLLEGGLMATYQVRTNFSVRLAYDAMWLQGVAIAPNNMRIAEVFPKFEVTGDALFHGLSAGFEMLW